MTEERLAALFTEWQRRYYENPTTFDGIDGENYGAACAAYILELDGELSK